MLPVEHVDAGRHRSARREIYRVTVDDRFAGVSMRDFPHEIDPVEEIDASDQATQILRVDEHRPFLCKGLNKSWPMASRVDSKSLVDDRIALFAEYLAGTEIRFTYTSASQKGDIGIGPDLAPNFRMDERSTSASDFLAMIAALVKEPTGECVYAAALPLSTLPHAVSQLGSLDTIGGNALWQRNLWIGSGEHVVDLHFDMKRNFISMIDGIKRVTLFPPEALPYIYPAPLHKPVAGVTRSLVKLLDTNFDAYPRFESALQMAEVAVVGPGDTLHVPPLWWHHVESYGFNVMVNAWYEDIDAESRQAFERASVRMRRNIATFSGVSIAEQRGTRFSRRLAAIKNACTELPKYWGDYLQEQYDYYVFRKYGDPYPTLPGMFEEVASVMRPHIWRGIRRRAARLRQILRRQ